MNIDSQRLTSGCDIQTFNLMRLCNMRFKHYNKLQFYGLYSQSPKKTNDHYV